MYNVQVNRYKIPYNGICPAGSTNRLIVRQGVLYVLYKRAGDYIIPLDYWKINTNTLSAANPGTIRTMYIKYLTFQRIRLMYLKERQ